MQRCPQLPHGGVVRPFKFPGLEHVPFSHALYLIAEQADDTAVPFRE
jgi:hypothetical protein